MTVLWIQKKQAQCLTAMMVSVAVSMSLICFNVYLLCINSPDFFFPSHVVWESPGRGAVDEDDRGGFSEHELLDIMYNTCNSSNTGTQVYANLKQILAVIQAL